MDPLIAPLGWGEMGARIGAALVAAAVVGIEREIKRHPAGLRTMMMVGLGSAMFVIAGHEMLAAQAEGTRRDPAALSDMSRVLQGVIGGIGFLGAGAVMHARGAVKGLTTAASIWVTAGLGIACGLGLYQLAALGSGAALFTLAVLGVVEKQVQERLGLKDTSEVKQAEGEARPHQSSNSEN